jgi:hypothetical protein
MALQAKDADALRARYSSQFAGRAVIVTIPEIAPILFGSTGDLYTHNLDYRHSEGRQRSGELPAGRPRLKGMAPNIRASSGGDGVRDFIWRTQLSPCRSGANVMQLWCGYLLTSLQSSSPRLDRLRATVASPSAERARAAGIFEYLKPCSASPDPPDRERAAEFARIGIGPAGPSEDMSNEPARKRSKAACKTESGRSTKPSRSRAARANCSAFRGRPQEQLPQPRGGSQNRLFETLPPGLSVDYGRR